MSCSRPIRHSVFRSSLSSATQPSPRHHALDQANSAVLGWTPDGESIYVAPIGVGAKDAKVSRLNIQTGKMEPWKTFGAGESGWVAPPHLSSDGTAYAYLYDRVLSEAYVVKGLR